MSGEISSVSQLTLQQTQATQRPKDSTSTQGSNKSQANTDTVQLTDEAATLQRLEKQIAATPVVDTQRVEAIRAAIASGDYQVDSDKVATKMIALENALAEKAK